MKTTLGIFFLLYSSIICAQDFGGNKVAIGNFVQRMYTTHPFNGIKILQTQDGIDYMISIVQLDKDLNKSENIQSRIASIKAKSYVNQYLNGSIIISDVIIISSETKIQNSMIKKTEIQEILKEKSMGFVEGMELLNNFESTDGKVVVYIFYREIKK